MWTLEDYPRAPLLEAITTAGQYGLFDLERVENLILRKFGNKDLTEALLSRLRHQCQTIRINGPSLREPQG